VQKPLGNLYFHRRWFDKENFENFFFLYHHKNKLDVKFLAFIVDRNGEGKFCAQKLPHSLN
jgi:hypothetical protein